MYEQMELEFKAYCKNQLARARVWSHLEHITAVGIEPNEQFV